MVTREILSYIKALNVAGNLQLRLPSSNTTTGGVCVLPLLDYMHGDLGHRNIQLFNLPRSLYFCIFVRLKDVFRV